MPRARLPRPSSNESMMRLWMPYLVKVGRDGFIFTPQNGPSARKEFQFYVNSGKLAIVPNIDC
ncbi:hypothetical protein N7528_002862 [Penicillium herquei]|nr:hypothetical protein N7528_002862 [Penicillium herquei]